MAPLAHDPTAHPVFSASAEHAVSAWHNVLVAYFPDRVTVAGLAAVHAANMALLADYPDGTVTLSVVRAGMPMPRSDVRAFAAKIGRAATGHLRGECIVINGHPLWARTARAVLHTIQLVSTPLHPRAVFDSLGPACEWVLSKAARPVGDGPALLALTEALVESHRGHG